MSHGGSLPKARRAGTSNILALAAFVLASFAAGWIGSIATSAGLPGWYDGLAKPGFTPPGTVFPVVWAILYVLMGLGAWLVWLTPGSVARNTALTVFFVQLALNAGWSWAFFGAQSTGLGLVAIIALFLAIAWLTLVASTVSRAAALIFLPYLAWVGFAGLLNTMIFFLN